MQQVCVHGPGDVRVDDVAPPDPGPRDALVGVAACGICGTDLSYIRMGGISPTGGPMPLGHEVAGVVEWVGPEVAGVAVGDRVVVHPGDLFGDPVGVIGNGAAEGGLTPSLLVRDAARGGRLVPVPGALALEVAALAEPLAVGIQAVNQADVGPGDTVAVFGCGPIGLAAIATLADRGIEAVGIDLSARRRDLAALLGARAVLDPGTVDVWDELTRLHGRTRSAFGPAPATRAFVEATGAAAVLTEIVERAGVGAHLSVVAIHWEPVPTNYLLVVSKQLRITGSIGYPARFEDAVDLLARRDLSAMITHRVPLERFDDALDILGAGKECGKVLVTMGADA